MNRQPRRRARISRARARQVQTVVAVLGFLALLLALLGLPYDGGPVPPAIGMFFVVWCVGVPYWYFLEYRYLLERDEQGRPTDRALLLQRYSQLVWLGAAIALAAFIVRG